MKVPGVWFRVEGRVQGVGFRAFVESLADSLDVTGSVWNTRDGAVEGEAFGDETCLERFLTGLRNGPGRVANVESAPLPPEEHSQFVVGPTR